MPDKNKILIAEDHPATLKLLEDILHEEFTVYSATNGREALEIVKNNPDLDLILLDIIMPEIDGHEVCRQLKNNPLTREIPIIFLTIKEEDIDEAEGFKLGAADYIIKPISRLRLKARISNQIQLKINRDQLVQKTMELQEAMEQLKTLRGILPICSFCKQIRNDDGYWQQVEEYIRAHSEAKFSHSVCPDCVKKHYADLHGRD